MIHILYYMAIPISPGPISPDLGGRSLDLDPEEVQSNLCTHFCVVLVCRSSYSEGIKKCSLYLLSQREIELEAQKKWLGATSE